MESFIVILIKLKYDHQTKNFKWHLDEGWNRRGAAATPYKVEGKYWSQEKGCQVWGQNQYRESVWRPTTSLDRPHKDHWQKLQNIRTTVSPLLSLFWTPPKSGGGSEYFPLARSPPPPSTVAPDSSTGTRGVRRSSSTPLPCQMTSVYPLLPCCCHLLIPEGSVGFPSSIPPHLPWTMAPAPSPETREWRKSRRMPLPFCLILFPLDRRMEMMPAIIASAGAATAAISFSFRDAPSLSMISPPPKSTEANASTSAPAFSLRQNLWGQRRNYCSGRPPSRLLPSLPPASCWLGIIHALLTRNQIFQTTG